MLKWVSFAEALPARRRLVLVAFAVDEVVAGVSSFDGVDWLAGSCGGGETFVDLQDSCAVWSYLTGFNSGDLGRALKFAASV